MNLHNKNNRLIRNVRSKKQPEWNKNLSLFGFPETFSCATFKVQFTITSQIRTLNAGYWENQMTSRTAR